MRLTRSEQQAVFDIALEKKDAFFVDWNLDAEDVAFNIKETVPDLEIIGLQGKQVLGDWIETVIIEGKEYKFNLNSETKPLEIVSKANQHLKKTGQTFVFFDSKDDEYCFILIDLSELPSYLEKGFIEI